jgi:hypothetical protein
VGFDIPVQQSSLVDGSQGPANLDPDCCHFRRWERSLPLERLLERAPVHELHPNTHAAVNAISPMDRDDIRVTHPSQQSAFFDNS